MNKENLEAVIKVRRQDGGVASVRCRKWAYRTWYQPIGNEQEVPESWTLIPRGVPTTGAREHCVVFVADGVEGAEVWVDHATSMPHPDTKAYVVGFLFDPHLERVLCIRKLRPAWQARKEYRTLNEKAESRMQKEWAKDKTVASLIAALKVFGTHTTKAELVTQVRLVTYPHNNVYSDPAWTGGRRGWGRYEVDLNMEIAGRDVEVERLFKLDDELTTALAAWKRTVAEGTKMLENIALLEQELKDLPEKAASLEAQVLRQQIAGDAKFGGKMTALLDSARASSSGGLMRLL